MIDYVIGFRFLDPVVRRLFVEPTLRRTFAYRQSALAKLLRK